MGIPPRAVQNLSGYARPRGDTGDWPLDDVRIRQFEETVKLRKKVAAAARLYRSLLFLSAISLAVFVPITLFAMLSPRGMRQMNGLVSLPATGLMLALGLLYFFAHRATLRSHRWAPITMFIVFIVSGAYQIASVALFAAAPAVGVGGPPIYVFQSTVGIVVLLFAGGFALVSWRAISAIPKYLAQPAWCQELIVKTGL
jgi:cation transport ATPase